VTPPSRDKDPESEINIKVNVTANSSSSKGYFVKVVHTTASGATHDTDDRYVDRQTGTVIEWGSIYWSGRDKNNPAVRVFGVFGTNEKHEMTYVETVSKKIGKERKTITEITSKCDPA
jgi:hypothetical protein